MANIIPDDLDWQMYDVEQEQVKVRPASDFMDEVIDSYYADNEAASGDPYPWEKAERHGLRFRMQEITIYGGHSESFKSMCQGQVAVNLMRDLNRPPAKSCILSFEMRPQKTLKRMVRQASGTEQPSIRYMKMFKDYTDEKLWLYDHLGQVAPRKVLAVCRYAVTELGCTHLFIDSLMKVIDGTDDYNAQKKFIGDLNSLAQAHNCHAHLVAHSRKPGAERKLGGKHDISGASEIEKQADNVLMFQMNEKKYEGQIAGEPFTGDESAADIFVTVAKHREGEFHGTFAFGIDKPSLCITDTVGGRWPALNIRGDHVD